MNARVPGVDNMSTDLERRDKKGWKTSLTSTLKTGRLRNGQKMFKKCTRTETAKQYASNILDTYY